MKKIIKVLIVVLLCSIVSPSAYSWTTCPFRVGQLSVYNAEGVRVEDTYYATSMPLYLKHNQQLTFFIEKDFINQIGLSRVVDKEDKVWSKFNRDHFVRMEKGEAYDLAVKMMKQVADLLVSRSETVTICYTMELQVMALFFGPERNTELPLYEDVVKFLNKERSRKLSQKEYLIDPELLKLMEGLKNQEDV